MMKYLLAATVVAALALPNLAYAQHHHGGGGGGGGWHGGGGGWHHGGGWHGGGWGVPSAWMCEPHGYFYRHHHMRQMLPMRPMHHVMRPERPVSHPHPMH
jgi:hypothetical protein